MGRSAAQEDVGVHELSQRRPRSWQEMREQEILWLIERTGEGLEPAKNFAQSSVTHKIGLTSADDVDDEVVGWIKRSYAANT
jgi:hypothetical protein